MYPVTTEFQNKIKETTRTFKLSVQIQYSSGILELTDKDIVGGSVVFTESSQTGDDFSIGGTVASTFEFELFRKPEHDLITFEGATVIPQVGLLISSSVDIENYFINAPQPSEFEDSQILEQWEFVPLGRFNVDEINKSRNSIKLKAIDNMIELDKPYSLSNLSYPANLYQIYQNICSVADIQPATTSFTNQNHIVQTRPDGDYSLRDILGFVAELSGSFARCNRNGALELAWYEDVGLTLDANNRFDFKPREDLIQIKGVKFETEDTVYIAGTDDYVVDLTDNPLLQDSYSTVLANIYNKVKQVVFTPFESRWQGNPAIQTGDIITQVDRDNVSHATLVTHSTYKYRGASTLAARGLPLKAKGYKGSTNKKIAEVRRVLEDNFNRRINEMQQAIEDEMIVTYYQETEPSAKLGDLWFNTTTKKLYRHNGITFDLVEDKDITTAIELAQDAQTTADGKIVSYYQDEMPSEGTIGDLWIDTNDNNKLYRYNGTTYVSVQDKNIDKLATDLNNAITDVNTDISTLEQSVLNATEMIANMLGGYAFYEADGFYVADNPVLANAQKVWKWGIGGFGYSSTGVEGPYTSAITADGTIVAMLLAANIITADMVKTGILSSEDDSTWINLNDGTFNFKNLLSYIDGKLEVNSPEIIRSDVSYKGATIGLDYGIYVDFGDGGHAQIGDGSILVQHTDGSHTKIDGRGIMRQFSVPIFEQSPSGIDIVETFESGNIADTRVDLESSWYAVYSDLIPVVPIHDVADKILVTTNAKYSGSYGLELICPKATSGATRGLECYFINYRPTKDTMLTLKYKTNLSSSSSARLHIKDVDTPGSSTQSVPLNSSVWAEASYLLQENTTYRISIYIHNTSSSVGTVYIDDVVFEENVNEPVIVGYEQSLQPYYDFTYIRKGHFDANGTQQIVLPDYFRGMNFDVFIMPTGNWEWYSTSLSAGEPRIQVDSINNMVPSFTCTYFRYPQKAVDFIYTVVLNN